MLGLLALTTSVMLRTFLVMASLSWLGVGVNQSFWNVSFTSFCGGQGKNVLSFICIISCVFQSFKRYSLKTHTLIPSSSLTLRIILTHISVILWKVGCSRQMSLRILMTLFLTLMPVSYRARDRFTLQLMDCFSSTCWIISACIWYSQLLA